MHTTYVNWNGNKVKLTWTEGGALPPLELITSVHGLCFDQGNVLMVDHKARGNDIPGGHLEPNETPEECLRREVFEEGYVRGGTCTLLGCVAVDHTENPEWRPGRYPMIGYQVYYRMEVAEVLPFEAQFESARRFFAPSSDVPTLHHDWNLILDLALEAALATDERHFSPQ